MFVKQLIKNKQDYWNFTWQFLQWTVEPNKSLWKEEDYPKLKPFFNAQHQIGTGEVLKWTPEVMDSFDFYQKCNEQYGKARAELRDAVSQFTPEELLKAFGYVVPNTWRNDDDDFCESKPLELDDDFDAEFPFIVIGDISSDYDRLGKIRIMGVYHVSLKDFAPEKE